MTLSDPQQRTVQRAQRELNNYRSFLRRKGTTGWVDRNARWNHQSSVRAVAAVEDALGVSHSTSVRLSDRLNALTDEARRSGLLSDSDVIAIGNEVLS